MTNKFDKALALTLEAIETAAKNGATEYVAVLNLTEAYTRLANLKLAEDLVNKYSSTDSTTFSLKGVDLSELFGGGKKN